MAILLVIDDTVAVALRGPIGPGTVVVTSPADLHRELTSEHGHDLVVIGPDVDESVAFDLAATQRVRQPALGVVLVRKRVHSAVLREAMLAGVREVVPADDLAALGEACQRSRQLSDLVRGRDGVAAASQGQLVTVFAAKGGAGKTTVATNLATAFTVAGRSVCLVDLDLAFGDVAIALQLNPMRTLADVLGLSAVDESAVRSLMTSHPCGLDTILAPVEPGSAEAISAEIVGDLLDLLRSMYDVVVVDTPPAFTDHVLAALDRSDRIVLLTTLDIPALKNLKLALETLDMLAYPRERWQVVLNRGDAKVGLSAEDVERTLNTKIVAQVPSSRAVPASVNRGVPIVLDQAGHPVSVAIRRLAEGLLASTALATSPRGARRVLSLLRKAPVA